MTLRSMTSMSPPSKARTSRIARNSIPRTRSRRAGRCALGLLTLLIVLASLAASDTAPVGRSGSTRLVTPVNQIIQPYGRQVDLPGLRPQALALSPNGKLLAVSGKTNQVLILDPVNGAILQRVSLPAESTNQSPATTASPNFLKPDTEGQ